MLLSSCRIFFTVGICNCWNRVLNVAERFDQNSVSPEAVRYCRSLAFFSSFSMVSVIFLVQSSY